MSNLSTPNHDALTPTIPPELIEGYRASGHAGPADFDAILDQQRRLTAADLAAMCCADQEQRWRRGDRVGAEYYLARLPALRADPEFGPDLVYHEYLLRRRLGDPPSAEEMRARFPEFADALAAQLQVHHAVGEQAEVLADWPVLPGYDLLAEIGRGGMGVVFKARHRSLERLVAIKLLQEMMHHPETLARFRAEAVILARLQHPSIVQIFEIGEMARTSGIAASFMAMEYVPGGTLSDRLREGVYDARQAACLVETLARAMAVAHAAGIIHRDLKPSNVLLAVDTPKIADFGLAKELVDPNHSNATAAGVILGTPSYMAPEQARGETRTVGPSADVYALGGILYECLTGRPPFRGATTVETLRLVIEVDPVPVRRLRPETPQDLETIVHKCLQKESERRYSSSAALADDLRRFLEGRPIAARPVSRLERSWRWARRNPLATALLAALLAAILIGGAGILWQWRQARHAAELAEQRRKDAETARNLAIAESNEKERQRQLAEDSAKRARDIQDYLQQEVFHLAAPSVQHEKHRTGGLPVNPELKLRDLILTAARTLDGKFPDQPLVEAELRNTLGWTLREMGRADLAIAQHERARQLYEKHQGVEHRDSIRTVMALALSHAVNGNVAEGLRLREETLKQCRELFGPEDPDTLQCMVNVAASLAQATRYKEALELRQEALKRRLATLGVSHPDTLWSMHQVAVSFADLGRQEEALALFRELLAIRTMEQGGEHPDALECMDRVARCLAQLGRYQESKAEFEKVVRLRRVALGDSHPHTLGSRAGLASAHYELGDYRTAKAIHEEVAATRASVLGPDHAETLGSLGDLANAHHALGEYAKALALQQQVFERLEATLGLDHLQTLQTLNNLANCHLALRNLEKAQALHEKAHGRLRDRFGPEHATTLRSQTNLAGVYTELGKHREALALNRDTWQSQRTHLGPDHPDTLITLANLANNHFALKEFPRAVLYQMEALDGLKSRLGARHVVALNNHLNLAAMFLAWNRPEDALPMIEEGIALAKSNPVTSPQIYRLVDLKVRHHVARGDVKGCRDSITVWEELGRTEAIDLYNSACLRAILSGLLRKGKQAEALAEAERAVAFLRRAIVAGFSDRALLEHDADLDALRERDDFQALLRDLPRK